MAQTIYHYCNLSSFEGIIKSKNLWLSNAFKSNDSYELNWMFELMKDVSKPDRSYIARI